MTFPDWNRAVGMLNPLLTPSRSHGAEAMATIETYASVLPVSALKKCVKSPAESLNGLRSGTTTGGSCGMVAADPTCSAPDRSGAVVAVDAPSLTGAGGGSCANAGLARAHARTAVAMQRILTINTLGLL